MERTWNELGTNMSRTCPMPAGRGLRQRQPIIFYYTSSLLHESMPHARRIDGQRTVDRQATNRGSTGNEPQCIIFDCPTDFAAADAGRISKFSYLCRHEAVGRLAACAPCAGGKSGQHRASHFLTESRPRGWSNAEEKNRLRAFLSKDGGKGEKAG